MKEKRVITTSGKSRGTLYHLGEAPARLIKAKDNKEAAGNAIIDIIPLSEEGREVLASVSRPVAIRHPVGYNLDFLLSYRPNADSLYAVKLPSLPVNSRGLLSVAITTRG